MLSREQRFTAQDFKNFSAAKSALGKFFLVKTAPAQHATPRFGIIIPSKHIRLSYARNRNKRRLRACLARLLSKIKQHCDIVIIVTKNTKNVAARDLCGELTRVLFRLGALPPSP